MRNSIAWTRDNTFPKQPASGQSTVDLSLLAARALKTGAPSFLLDPWKSLKAIVLEATHPGTRRLVLHNLGILVEPELHIATEKFLLDLALDFDVVVIWPWAVEDGRKLVWDPERPDINLEFEPHILTYRESAT